MKKIIIISISLFVLIACNSNEKKSKSTAQNNSVTKQDLPLLKESIERGKIIYNKLCITCHLTDGKGVSKIFPPLADSDFLQENQTESIKAIKHGLTGKITVNGIDYNSVMSPLGLSNKEVADAINYINNNWGNNIDNFVTPEKVSEL
ncbi:c-type cytochrome [Winogradskyella undariae]|uniref:c-type cytochrome n=1 Tax=Winogradskyella undariae TaxID=1285465 RepID=UPI00156ACB87|nr:cytochrome c [Winogradskyella undariae]NRR90571.1 c-type cytochrome [Winogradskyella undariae]